MNTLYTGIKQNEHKHFTQAYNKMSTGTNENETGYVKIVHIMKFTLFSLSLAHTHTHGVKSGYCWGSMASELADMLVSNSVVRV